LIAKAHNHDFVPILGYLKWNTNHDFVPLSRQLVFGQGGLEVKLHQDLSMLEKQI